MIIVQAGTFPINIHEIKGGVEASIFGISSELTKKYKLYVVDYPRFSVKKDFVEVVNAINIFRFKSPFATNSSGLLRVVSICRKIRKIDPDICHIHSTGWMSLLLAILLKMSGSAVIITIHGLAHIEKKNNWNRKRTTINFIKFVSHSFAEFMLINLSKSVIVDTDYVRDSLHLYSKEHKICRLPDIYVIPQGIDDKYFNINSRSGFNNLLAVGSINPRKGYVKLLESVHGLIKYTSDFRLDIIGVVSDSNYLEELKNSLIKFDLQRNVFIHTDLSLDELLVFYSNASLFVLHTQEESQGIVFCEAMACGLPIVATNVGGVPYIVRHNQGGLLCDYGDIVSFTKNIHSLMNDSNLAKRFSAYNQIEAQKFNWNIISNNIVSLYKVILN